jgi:hypothetical protein
MVHALHEICRVLIEHGTIIDLRPLTGAWPVELVSQQGRQAVGKVTGVAESIADDAAANEAMEKAASEGLLRREQEELFDFDYYWNSPGEMKEYMDEEWDDFAGIEPEVWKELRRRWALADADARVSVRLAMLITRWKKLA